MSEYDREATIMLRHWATGGCCAVEGWRGEGEGRGEEEG